MTTQELRIESGLRELCGLISRFATSDGVHETAVPELALARTSATSERMHGVLNPCVCVIAQGAKRVFLGGDVLVYDRATWLAASLDLPAAGQVIEATPEAPYLGIKLSIDPREIAALLVDSGLPDEDEPAPARALFVSRTNAEFLEAFVRLVRLLESPEDIPALAPLARREILYRALKCEGGGYLRHLASANGRARRIARAVEWLRRHYERPLRVEELASLANMSASSFHEHFRSVTAMSPLQFQKVLRLQEARRLLLAEATDAASAGHRVGYESPSQFSREYSRLFGRPPVADIRRLRATAGAATAAA
jgi:AraC-like DNA-binding protein